MKQKNKKKITRELLTKNFYLLKEYDLIAKINAGSKSAETQLLIHYLPHLLGIAEDLAKHFGGKKEAMQQVMEVFLKGIKVLSYNYYRKGKVEYDYLDDGNIHIMEVYLRNIKREVLYYIRSNKEMLRPVAYNKTQISRLNALNELLKVRQERISEIVLEYNSMLAINKKEEGDDLNYSLSIILDYFLLEDSNPVHSLSFFCNKVGMDDLIQRFGDKGFDWRVEGMPILESSYCYLLSEIFEQWLIIHRIPDIALIRTSIQVNRQDSILLKNGMWVFV